MLVRPGQDKARALAPENALETLKRGPRELPLVLGANNFRSGLGSGHSLLPWAGYRHLWDFVGMFECVFYSKKIGNNMRGRMPE